MWTDEDRRRLLESRHDLGASEKPELMTADKHMKAALTCSRNQLDTARSALKSAAADVSREQSETDVERTRLQKAIGSAVGRYAFIRKKVEDALLNVDPDDSVEPEEIERRQKLFNRVFRAMPSDFERLSQGGAIEAIGAVAKALSDEPDLKPLGHAESLAKAHAAAESAARELNREVDEDAAAMVKLRAAREEFDRKDSAHALLVESILVREKKEEEMGRFLLARDPKYAARRAARVPLEQEPGVGEVDAEQTGGSPAPGD